MIKQKPNFNYIVCDLTRLLERSYIVALLYKVNVFAVAANVNSFCKVMCN